jgi:hypothetical protein
MNMAGGPKSYIKSFFVAICSVAAKSQKLVRTDCGAEGHSFEGLQH